MGKSQSESSSSRRKGRAGAVVQVMEHLPSKLKAKFKPQFENK
jgi:hypothetical protein